MHWDIFSNHSDWSAGTSIQLSQFPDIDEFPTPTVGDELKITSSNNEGAEGAVISSSANQIVVSIAGASWRLETDKEPQWEKNGKLTFSYFVKARA